MEFGCDIRKFRALTSGISTRVVFKIISKVFNFDRQEVAAQYQDGYRWAGEHAVNEESLCSIGATEFQRGCKDLVQDEMLDRWS